MALILAFSSTEHCKYSIFIYNLLRGTTEAAWHCALSSLDCNSRIDLSGITGRRALPFGEKVLQFNQNTILSNQLVQSASPIMAWVEQDSVLRVPWSCFWLWNQNKKLGQWYSIASQSCSFQERTAARLCLNLCLASHCTGWKLNWDCSFQVAGYKCACPWAGALGQKSHGPVSAFNPRSAAGECSQSHAKRAAAALPSPSKNHRYFPGCHWLFPNWLALLKEIFAPNFSQLLCPFINSQLPSPLHLLVPLHLPPFLAVPSPCLRQLLNIQTIKTMQLIMPLFH